MVKEIQVCSYLVRNRLITIAHKTAVPILFCIIILDFLRIKVYNKEEN